jgi:hypothetical protein
MAAHSEEKGVYHPLTENEIAQYSPSPKLYHIETHYWGRVESPDTNDIPKSKTLLGVGLLTTTTVAALWHITRGSKIPAVQRLQQRAGYGTWTMTPTGRRDALEASGFRIPASILYQGLDRTLTWLADDTNVTDKTVYNMLVRFETRRIIKKSTIGRMVRAKYLDTPASKETMMILSKLAHSSHKQIIETFPYVLEILLTDPFTGRPRPCVDVKDMCRFNRGFLGM